MTKILIVEDDADINNAVAEYLTARGCSCVQAFSGTEGALQWRAHRPDLVVADLMLPGMTGQQLIAALRAELPAPVIVLSARTGLSDKVELLDQGADDYLTKPFALEELLARVRALLRRDAGRADNCYRLADLTVDCDARTARRGDVEITLSSKEFSILEYLIRNQGVVLSRDKIEQHIWNYDYAGGSNVVDVYIRYLRKKIDDGFSPKLIHTVRGAGYVLREQP